MTELIVGDFYRVTLDNRLFLVWIENTEPLIVGSSDWLSTSPLELTLDRWQKGNPTYVCHGKRKWWWKWLPWRSFLSPYAPCVEVL